MIDYTLRQGRDAAQCAGIAFWHGVWVQTIIFLPRREKKADAFPAFFRDSGAKEWRVFVS